MMHDHWTKFGPPVYMAVAGYLGLIETKDKGKRSSTTPNKPTGTMADLAAQFPSGAI